MSAAKFIDVAAFRFRQTVDDLGRTLYYAKTSAFNLDAPLFEDAGAEVRAHFWLEAEQFLLRERPHGELTGSDVVRLFGSAGVPS